MVVHLWDPSGARPGALLGCLGGLSGRLETLLGSSWNPLGSLWDSLGGLLARLGRSGSPKGEHAKNIRFTGNQ
eukprot:6315943-Pyramimonas_sp.AAC.1